MKEIRLNRLLGVASALVLTLIMLLALSRPVKASTKYNVWVAGIQMTSDRRQVQAGDAEGVTGGTATYDPDNKTLTLDNFKYEGYGYPFRNSFTAAIYVENTDITIIFRGENSINDRSNSIAYGIKVEEDNNEYNLILRSDDDGKLTVMGTGHDQSYGIVSKANVTIESGTVEAYGKYSTYNSYGMYVDNNLIIKGGSVMAQGGDTSKVNSSSYGMYARDNIIISEGTLIAKAGTASVDCSYGMYAGQVVIIGDQAKSVEASGNDKAIKTPDQDKVQNGIPGEGWANPEGSGTGTPIEINNKGQELDYKKVSFFSPYDVWVAGIRMNRAKTRVTTADPGVKSGTATYDHASKTLTLDNFNYEGPGADLLGDGTDCHGILTGYEDFTISFSGENFITCTSGSGSSIGINSWYNLTLHSDDNGTLTARGNADNPENSNGICGDVTIERGRIKAYGGKASRRSTGLIGGDVIIKGGSLMAVGDTNGIYCYTVEIGSTAKSVEASGEESAIAANKITNQIPGSGWPNADGSGTQAYIPAGTTEQGLPYKKLYFDPQVTEPAPAPKTIEATATGFNGIYNDAAHGIEVKVTEPANATVLYGTAEGVYNLTEPPHFYDAGEHVVYYQVTAPGYEPVTGRATVNIQESTEIPNVKLDGYVFEFKNKAIKPKATVTYNGVKLKKSEYSLKYSKGCKNVGTYKVTITFKGKKYKNFAKQTQEFEIVKADNPLKVEWKKPVTVKYKSLQKKDQKLEITKVLKTKKKGQKNVTYAIKGNDGFTIPDPKKGKITVKKGLDKGTYYLTLMVHADGGSNYKPADAEVPVTITVK